jgi:hypothetical protein
MDALYDIIYVYTMGKRLKEALKRLNMSHLIVSKV